MHYYNNFSHTCCVYMYVCIIKRTFLSVQFIISEISLGSLHCRIYQNFTFICHYKNIPTQVLIIFPYFMYIFKFFFIVWLLKRRKWKYNPMPQNPLRKSFDLSNFRSTNGNSIKFAICFIWLFWKILFAPTQAHIWFPQHINSEFLRSCEQ